MSAHETCIPRRLSRGARNAALAPAAPPPPQKKKKKNFLKEEQLTLYLSSAKKVLSVRHALQILEGLNGGVTLMVDG